MSLRSLKDSEIDYILKDIKYYYNIPSDVNESSLTLLKDKLRKQLKDVKINEKGIKDLKQEIEQNFHKTLVNPGEMVGILTAQSIGERQTQMTLNTFHSAGLAIKTVVTGVPRFTELLNATKDAKAKSCHIYLNGNCKTIEDTRKIVSSRFKCIYIKDLVDSFDIFDYKKDDENWYIPFKFLYPNENYENPNYNCCITFKLNKRIMYEFNITSKLICDRIMSEFKDIYVIYSPLPLSEIHLFFDSSEIDLNGEEKIMYITQENIIKIYLEEVVIPVLNDIYICGTKGITDIYYKKMDDNWTIETDGTNLCEVLALDNVDVYNTSSDDMWEILNCFGIEAAREFLIDEFMNVVSSDGTYINERHVTVLVDIMTSSGTINSVSRYGMKKGEMGPLAKASFEESIDNFLKAGAFGEIESTNGVSASIMVGKRSKVGTGICDLVMDNTRFPSHDKVFKASSVKENTFDDTFEYLNKIYQDDDNVEVKEVYDDHDSSVLDSGIFDN